MYADLDAGAMEPEVLNDQRKWHSKLLIMIYYLINYYMHGLEE
jgi:hypothetical protein